VKRVTSQLKTVRKKASTDQSASQSRKGSANQNRKKTLPCPRRRSSEMMRRTARSSMVLSLTEESDGRKEQPMQQKIVPNLWFDTEAEEAAKFYVSIFEEGRIVNVTHYTEAGPRPAGTVMTVEFEIAGERFVGINGGPQFKFDEAVSFQIACEDQDEVDYFWERLSEGGEEGQCGWLKDRYGLSWQVVPTGMEEVFADPDPERARRAMKAMLGMRKLDVAALRRAADGEDP
jgi:predicted 3-demethylubiquinone-9 3-methyltransferase (glyoxalase superfamily)